MTSTVNADGSWTRKTVYSVSLPDEKGMNANAGPKIEDVFKLPTVPGWKITQKKDKDQITVTAERTVQVGETLKGDIALKGDEKAGKSLLMVNEAHVREIAPGRLMYKEVLHWQGPTPKFPIDVDAGMIASIKSVFPPKLATEANVRDFTQAFQREFVRVMFGPGDPMLSQVLGEMSLNPDLVERQLKRRLGGAIVKALEAKFGAEMSAEERLAITRKLVSDSFRSTQAQVKSKAKPDAMAAPGSKDTAGGLTALMFVVKLPGKVTATNGEQDELTGETYWSLYPEAAALGDVVLTATCDVGK